MAYNPRLLRTSIFGKTVDDVIFRMAAVGTFTYSATASGVYRVIEYVYGSTMWCGACHDRFQVDEPDGVNWIPGTGSHGEVDASWCVSCHLDTAGDHDTAGSGHAGEYLGFHRHPVNVPHVALTGEADVSVETGTPLEHPRGAEGPYGGCGMCHPDRTDTVPTGDTVGNLSCLTCHRAHSSIASAEG